MKGLLKRTAIIYMMLAVMLSMMPMIGTVTSGKIGAQNVYAESEADVNVNGFKFHLWIGTSGASVALRGYTGSATEIVLPTSVSYGGKTYKASEEGFWIDAEAFRGNTKITKVAIPHGYEAISEGAFKGCSSLTEIAIGDSVSYISSDIFDDCSKLTVYYFSGTNITGSESAGVQAVINSGLGQNANGQPLSGVTVYTVSGSVVEKAVNTINDGSTNGNKIKVIPNNDPYSMIKISSIGEDGTAYGKGASESVVDKAITRYAKESDPKGTVFGLLKAKISKVAKNAVTVKWSKVNGATRYVVYGNACGTKNRLVRLKSTGNTKVTFKKVNKKKVKKGTYYKFMIVAFDKNNKVVSTSKIVHAATKGGKVGNDKSVTVKAKVNAKGKAIKKYKVLSKTVLKKGKSITLKATATPQSKKLKVKRHRKVAFESSNPKVTTVSSKGKIKAKAKGTCYIYAYAQNGVMKRVKITVK